MSSGTERPRTRRQIANAVIITVVTVILMIIPNTHRTIRARPSRMFVLAEPSVTALEFIPNSLVANDARLAIVRGAGFKCTGLPGKSTYPERSRVMCIGFCGW